METNTYYRKPLIVEAVQVTEANILEVAKWCKGKVYAGKNGNMTLEVKVLHPMSVDQNKAQEGDWILKSKQGFKIYADTAFKKGFEKAEDEVVEVLREAFDSTPYPGSTTAHLQFNAPVNE
jgi:hypothetical protein